MLYDLIPTKPEHRLLPLMERSAEMLVSNRLLWLVSVGCRMVGWVSTFVKRWHSRWPEAAGILWIVCLAALLWIDAHRSVQPPIDDAFGYYEKAYNFWVAMHRPTWFNPLNLKPTFRPPGTVLMSYPFGFSRNPGGFYFRSVYFPAAMFFVAVMLTAYRADHPMPRRGFAILLAVFSTTVTLPYHFDIGLWWSGGYWGTVDGFLSGWAALAAALVWRGTRAYARAWCWAAATGLACMIAIIVKPSGAFVAAMAGLAWVAFAIITIVEAPVRMRARHAVRFMSGGALLAAMDVLMVAAALDSDYLSRRNLSFGLGAIAVMKTDMTLPWSRLWFLLNAALGVALLVWVGLAIIVLLTTTRSNRAMWLTPSYDAALVAAVGVSGFGVWFWLIGSGGATEIRYAMPFFMMAFIWLATVIADVPRFARATFRTVMQALMILSAANLAILLALPDPPRAWQAFSGVGVSSEYPPEIVAAFNKLLTTPSSVMVSIYIFSNDANDAVLSSMAFYDTLMGVHTPPLSVGRPVDWVRPMAFRISDIANADYLIVDPQQERQAPSGPDLQNFWQQQGAFTVWVDRLGADDGTTTYFASPTARIVKVTDQAKFRASLARFVADHRWDSVFMSENRMANQ